ncbi:leucine-rich repeat-containing protein 56 [Chanos chanos]|uniref:Leucine-rich repeat-containing protein 56 n=1 Tax=Chanos chanos TaxID=29144 RepID=A0A6J2WP90_CHACN|nr:leucine-rich repeat-containing protein 56 [Chanos chanos]
MSFSRESVRTRRSGRGRPLITELSGSDRINPTPSGCEDTDLQVDLYLSPEKLRSLTGFEDLREVTSLEMSIDTRQNTLGNFGTYLPKLVQLKMNNSLILSVRDLGTTLSHLHVLWLARCGLADLDGIPSFSSLKELYVAYNNISDLSQVSMLECLELLDLEGNNVDDLVQVQFLGLCGRLRTLNLEGNPVCIRPHPSATESVEYGYRSSVRKLIPQLLYLDDVSVEEEDTRVCKTSEMEWVLLKESIKDCNPSDDLEPLEDRGANACGYSRPCSAHCLGADLSSANLPSRPSSAGPLSSSSSRPGSAESDPASLDHDASDLTHGAGKIVFCGNPVQALRERRQKLTHRATSSNPRPSTQLSYVPEHTYDIEDSGGQGRNDIFAELRAWREEHSRRLMMIEKARQPQIMSIIHSEGGGVDSEEEEVSGHTLSVITDKQEEREDKTACGRRIENDSPDSSFHSPSPDLLEREAVSPEISRLTLSSDHTLSPSPPLTTVSPTGGRKLAEIRARRLRLVRPCIGTQKPAEKVPIAQTGDPTMDRPVELCNSSPGSQQLHQPNSSPLVPGCSSQCAEAAAGCCLSVCDHKPVISLKTPGRQTHTRPHTARAALQKPANYQPLLPSRWSSHLD